MPREIAPIDGRQPTQLDPKAQAYAQAAMARNTRRAYRSDWDDFASWCASDGTSPLPADPATIANYLSARAPTLAASTLARRLAAIRTGHREAGHAVPESGDLRRVWSGIRRQTGRPPGRKRALVTEDLRRVVARLPATARGTRDRALLLVGFAAALRRSELAALSLEGPRRDSAAVRCSFVPGGLQITIARSKGDQEGQGQVVGVPHGRTKLCPVAALHAWLEQARIREGPIFRAVDRHGRIGLEAITGKAVGEIVKASAMRAGLDPLQFGGHSLRAGLITSAAKAGVATDVIMRQSRHARYDTVRGYIRDGEIFARNAAAKVGL